MKNRPLILWIVTGIHFAVALSFLLQVIFEYDFSLTEIHNSWFYLTSLNKILLFSSVAVGLVAFNGNFLLWPIIAINCILIFWNNYLVASWHVNSSPEASLWASIFYLLLTMTTLSHPVRLVLLHPEKRWWLNRRLQLNLKVLLQQDHNNLQVETFDISKSGAFLKYAAPYSIGVDPGSMMQITFAPHSRRPWQIHARLIRIADRTQGHYPVGLGVQFENLGWRDKLRIHLMQFSLLHKKQ